MSDITTTAGDLMARIAAIDSMFEAAGGWGSWMVSAANEREHLVNQLKSKFGVTVEHKYLARTSDGGRVS